MSLTAAIMLSVIFVAISAGVGVYLLRYRAAVTEMLGMMIGMTMGMMSGIAIGFFIGSATDMFASNLVGVIVGLAFGAGFGSQGGLMGAMDGAMGGFMGGMMGGMLGVMINISPLAVWVTAAFTTVICLAIYAGLIRLVSRSSHKQYAKDPVCDMLVDVATAKLTSEYHGETVYFCAPGCKRAFDKDPERYLVQSLRQREAPDAAATA
ncbi:MAG: YHS domain-containing protein, partial [Nitrososphaerales archaeon]